MYESLQTFSRFSAAPSLRSHQRWSQVPGFPFREFLHNELNNAPSCLTVPFFRGSGVFPPTQLVANCLTDASRRRTCDAVRTVSDCHRSLGVLSNGYARHPKTRSLLLNASGVGNH